MNSLNRKPDDFKNETITIEDFVDVEEKANQLDCNIPESLAILPRNFRDASSKAELIHEITTPTVRKLLVQNKIQETPLEKEGEKFPQIDEKSFEWIGPTILIASSVITQNPYLIEVTINVISTYLTDFFKGIQSSQANARLSIVFKNKSGTYKKINYSGHKDGLKDIPKIIKEVFDEQR